MQSVDIDGGGLLELNEIVTYVRQLGDEAPNKVDASTYICYHSKLYDMQIFNLEHRFAMTLTTSNPPVRYIPPSTGRVRLQVLDSFVSSVNGAALTRLQVILR